MGAGYEKLDTKGSRNMLCCAGVCSCGMSEYTDSVIGHIQTYASELNRHADTLYFGGGTPNLLGAQRLSALIAAAREGFALENAEITVEVNPAEDLSGFLKELRAAGANRLSIGLQSANEDELQLLGRRHTALQAAQAVRDAQNAGFGNISLDLMLSIQNQTKESLLKSIEFCAEANIQHDHKRNQPAVYHSGRSRPEAS